MSGNWTVEMRCNQTTVEPTYFTYPLLEVIANNTKLTTLSSVYNGSWITKTEDSSQANGIELRLFTSELEHVMFLMYIWTNGLVSLLLNFIVIFIITRERRLHTPENFIIGVDAINNSAVVLSTNSFMAAVLQTNSVRPNYYTCQVSGVISFVSFVYTTYLMFIYSYERYSFLCSPMTYGKRVTTRRVAVAMVVMVIGVITRRVAVAMVVMLILTSGLAFFPTFPNYSRTFSATGLLCVSQGVVRSAIVGLCGAALPTILMVIYAVFNIKRLQSRSVSVSKPAGESKEAKTAHEKQTKRQVSAIKTILLVSGAYYVVYFPMVIFRLVVNASVSPFDIEIRRYPVLTLVYRCTVIAMLTTTPFINPLLYLSTRKNLKAGLFNLLPWLRQLRRLRVKRVNVAESFSYTAG